MVIGHEGEELRREAHGKPENAPNRSTLLKETFAKNRIYFELLLDSFVLFGDTPAVRARIHTCAVDLLYQGIQPHELLAEWQVVLTWVMRKKAHENKPQPDLRVLEECVDQAADTIVAIKLLRLVTRSGVAHILPDLLESVSSAVEDGHFSQGEALQEIAAELERLAQQLMTPNSPLVASLKPRV